MKVDVLFLPSHATPESFAERAVVVFDVLRATTTMTAALAAGVGEIRVFGSLTGAAEAAARHAGARVLCGEENCLPPAGFDLGNSPGAFTREFHAGRTVYMSTTNGTRAIVAARDARAVFTGALVNASAVAAAVAAVGNDVSLLCAGTGGEVALEDVLGAGAVTDALNQRTPFRAESDTALLARRLYREAAGDLRAALMESRGGRNVIAAGLLPDIEFAARLDALDVAGFVERQTLSVKPWRPN